MLLSYTALTGSPLQQTGMSYATFWGYVGMSDALCQDLPQLHNHRAHSCARVRHAAGLRKKKKHSKGWSKRWWIDRHWYCNDQDQGWRPLSMPAAAGWEASYSTSSLTWWPLSGAVEAAIQDGTQIEKDNNPCRPIDQSSCRWSWGGVHCYECTCTCSGTVPQWLFVQCTSRSVYPDAAGRFSQPKQGQRNSWRKTQIHVEEQRGIPKRAWRNMGASAQSCSVLNKAANSAKGVMMRLIIFFLTRQWRRRGKPTGFHKCYVTHNAIHRSTCLKSLYHEAPSG